MKKRSHVWNFDDVNTERNISGFTRLMLVSLMVLFVVTPLSTISPETFVDPKTVFYFESCGCLIPCN